MDAFPLKILRSKERMLDLTVPQVMAIVNVTPDSFYFGSRFEESQALVDHIGEVTESGASLIDIGGMSSRPGAKPVTASEETARLLPALELIRKHFPALWISVDTWRSEVLSKVAECKIDMVNDISAGEYDQELLPLVAEMKLPYVLMHMPNPFSDMHRKQNYSDVVHSAAVFFHEKLRILSELGISDVVLDPGFGFGKSLRDNYGLLQDLRHFSFLGHPLLAGLSRKSMIQKVLEVEASHALNGTTALNMMALTNGARILRVHDVKEAVQCVRLYQELIASRTRHSSGIEL